MRIAVVAEKPSVARDIARALGANKRGEGFLEGNGYAVTWAVGHLVTLAEPHEMRAEWKRWRRDLLPMLPKEWPLVVIDKTRPQFEVVRRLLTSPELEHVICATDAGREGELIFRFIYEAAGCRKPVKRLWISSLTEDAIREGFKKLRPGTDFDPLAQAAKGRSRADWLVGMNLSRAYSLSLDAQLSVGRVQTPTLAMIVEREIAIRQFVPEEYLEVVATFSPGEGAKYDGTWFRPAQKKGDETQLAKQKRLPADGVEAKAIVARVKGGRAQIRSHTSERRKMPAPLLYDLTELQRHANRLFGYTAQKTLELAQKLYETHKLISYPRTDSRHLSSTVAQTLPSIVDAIREPYEQQLAPGTGQKPLGKRYVDDAQVSDHHAIIPTTTKARGLDRDEQRIYDLICRRLLQAWHDEFVWAATTVITEVQSPGEKGTPVIDLFHSSGTAVESLGWKVLDLGGEKKAPKKGAKAPKDKDSEDAGDDDDQTLPAGLDQGQAQKVLDAKSLTKKTRPPPRLTDASLLTAMETAGKTLDEKELSNAMRESGLGTPATRAAIIETLLARGYVVRRGKALEATDKGIGLVQVVDAEVKSPVMTGQWEARLQAIERGKGELPAFIQGIEKYVQDVLGRVPSVHPLRSSFERDGRPSTPAAAPGPRPSTALGTSGNGPGSLTSKGSASQLPPLAPSAVEGRAHDLATVPFTPRTPTPPDKLGELLERTFGFRSFRPHQEAVCRAATEGKDVLLVMPTGAGKSLCYQLPGLARAGTTLVVSPLIALMEDQVQKLQALGLRAERIHSGRDRLQSRQVCRDYVDGKLDFLFIAPERLGVPGFPELLARRTPGLVAIDEAHCISHWGHDFRPDYRLLGERLPSLRPAPIVAVTATATPVVQKDIAQQLGLAQERAFIHGFRRTNLAIEVREAGPKERLAVAKELLSDEARRPAILYAPTRKRAEEVADELNGEFRCAAYHAGMTPQARERIQTDFLSGRLDVVVATIAFGMGVDKADVRTVIHLALPSSLEAYYQEIGRAGRDGKESRAVLLHSWADRHTHSFFHERDYPEPKELQRLFDLLGDEPVAKERLRKRLKMDEESLDKALEKLWMHGGAEVSPEEEVRRGQDGWQKPYAAQRERRAEQVQLMGRFTEAHGCRMLHLVRHFGDREDSGKPCGLCDVCAPAQSVAVEHRPPTAEEERRLAATLEALRTQDRQSTGRLSKQIVGETLEDRKAFEQLLGGLVRAGLVQIVDDTFEKDGKSIAFQRACLTPLGRKAQAGSVLGGVRLVQAPAAAEEPRRGRKSAKGGAKGGAKGTAGAGGGRPRRERVEREESAVASPLAEALRGWRLAEARRRRVPAFRILTDRTLAVLAEERPTTDDALRAIPGIGPKIAESYGASLIALCRKGG